MPHTIGHKVVAGQEATSVQHIAAKSLGITLDALLSQVLQRLPIRRISSRTRNLSSEKVAEAGPTPRERLCHSGADGGLATADLARETDKEAHEKSKASCRERSETRVEAIELPTGEEAAEIKKEIEALPPVGGQLISARTGEGRARAKARGQSLGRPFKLTPHQRQEAVKRRKRSAARRWRS
jgi:hypothetical protein